MSQKVHFIGICGSGASGAAIAAKKSGFDVSGCSLSTDTPYSAQLYAAGIPVTTGHDESHVADADMIVSQAPSGLVPSARKECAVAESAGKLMTWQEFLGKHIFPGRQTIAVCGTHGKTTTTSMVAHVMEYAGLDPTAFVGAIVPAWNSSNRFGNSDWAVIEADEYANNFSAYQGKHIILNNIEMEHPEFFKDFEHYKETFCSFLANAIPGGVLVYNADDKNVVDTINCFAGKKIPFSIKDIKINANVDGQDFNDFHINLLGTHNVANAMATITLMREIGISDDVIRKALATFRGAGHRMEKLYADDMVTIYDDYAHHHTQAKNGILAVRAAHPDSKIIVIYEPHQISRYTQNTSETLAGLALADDAIIMDFWRGREAHLVVPNAEADIKSRDIKNVKFMPDDEWMIQAVAGAVDRKSVILVMGAGRSWKIAKQLVEIFEQKASK